jgi:formylglycine-generating enzyme required for sulfatase activity
VLRGGSWIDSPTICRSAFRYRGIPVIRVGVIGFRVVVVAGRVD